MIECLTNKHLDLSEIPELMVISQHLEEYYPDKAIYVFPNINAFGDITASYYIQNRCIVSSYTNKVCVRRIKHRKELVNKLTILGKEVYRW